MSLPMNRVALSAWLLSDPELEPGGKCSFLLFQHRYHESFSLAEKDLADGLLVRVVVMTRETAGNSLQYLRRGDRVSVEGQLQGSPADRLNSELAIHAWQVERSESLESLRFHSHPWHEIRARKETPKDSDDAPEASCAQ